jgi:2-oxoglutarate ferredoxin oxidoreductase subunit beta
MKKIDKIIEEISCKEKITWCPGCSNFSLLFAFKKAIAELIAEKKLAREKIVIVTGIGCHGKIHNYLNLSSINVLHGRVLPVLYGIKVANPSLIGIGFAGDADAYNEGIEHLIHAARYNFDITYIVHNNQTLALTTGQPTATTQKGIPTKVFKDFLKDDPLNPIKLMLSLNASFVARGFALEVEHLKDIFKEAILHKGFSFVEVLQPCIIHNDTREFIKKRIYKIEPKSLEEAWKMAMEWDYCYDNKKIPIGIFYKQRRETFEEKYLKNK